MGHKLVYQFFMLLEGLGRQHGEHGIGMPCYVDSQRLSYIASKKEYAMPFVFSKKSFHFLCPGKEAL
jgi:hypothetical protein